MNEAVPNNAENNDLLSSQQASMQESKAVGFEFESPIKTLEDHKTNLNLK
jgi:hypothetical protein